MTDETKKEFGVIGWTDLTVPNAEEIRDFYKDVVGWTPHDVDMDGYSDFNMNTAESGKTIAGICHARGGNTAMPAQWLMYITVEDVDAAARRCTELGGKIRVPAQGDPDSGRYCVIEDPAGAVAALYQPA